MATGTLDYLKTEVEKLRAENAKRRGIAKENRTEIDRLKVELTTANQKLTESEGKGGQPNKMQARIDELTSENRRLKHGAKFRDLAIAEGLLPEAIEDAWDTLKIKADADEPDEAGMKAALEAAKATKPYLFGPATVDPSKPATKPVPPSFGSGRGKDAPVGLTLTVEQRRDPKFMAENEALINQHSLNGTIAYKD